MPGSPVGRPRNPGRSSASSVKAGGFQCVIRSGQVRAFRAGAVLLTLPVKPVGWNPSGAVLPHSPLLYVSSATGPTHADPGYTLARGYQLDALEQEILTAMKQQTIVTVPLDESLGKGTVALSGTTLPYVVLCPPTAKR